MNNIFEAFNAKHLKSEDIVKNFVSSALFLETAQNGHTILVGPRGSGKTTFLRMLSNNTLPKWDEYLKNSYSNSIDYEGIYVPGDLIWGEMINSLESAGLSKQYSESFSYTAFCTHVFINTLESITTYIEKIKDEFGEEYLSQREDAIYEAITSIAETLKIKPNKFSLSRLRIELHKTLNELGEYSRYLSIFGVEKLDTAEFNKKVPYAHIDLKTTLESIFNAIDFALEKNEQRWAILLDEFEIAPKYLLDSVIKNMRSSAKKIMFKVALVPCGFHQEIKSQTSSINDYSVVELWYVKNGESAEFCKNLVKAKFDIEDPAIVLGSTKFTPNYKDNSKNWIKEFSELYSKDSSFKEFITSNKINIKREFGDDLATSSLVRKIAPVVAFRNAFLNVNGKRKGRKSLAEFYTGWEAISRISEGNPRWLMSTLNTLLGRKEDKRISDSDQISRVKTSTDAYCAMLSTLPLSKNMGLSTTHPTFELLETIASYFNKRLIDEEFKAAQPLTFMVDEKVDNDIESSLMIAWNYGAIVAVDTKNTFGTYDNLKGMRFRLSFLMSPRFELPVRMDKQINLSTILSSKIIKETSLSEEIKEIQIQRSLF
ncbi:ORC-CDC6 family AAA ATPase [Shewanella acanthi]|uniref:ORC-CDC6 family AAA ATPase n=1 Tax=Shewanella acanthi TaxID=2864212 RepID=UPI001C65AD3A|nr:P-loop NTPase fold protein [Shewanella acanthi]QYJ78334.1 hypothetical protein K0H61_14685 [Shewanella acanthi]